MQEKKTKKRSLLQDTLYSVGVACAKTAKIKNIVNLENISSIPKNAIETTKKTSQEAAKKLQEELSGINEALKKGISSVVINNNARKNSDEYKELSKKMPTEKIKLKEMPINVDFEKEIERIDKEINKY